MADTDSLTNVEPIEVPINADAGDSERIITGNGTDGASLAQSPVYGPMITAIEGDPNTVTLMFNDAAKELGIDVSGAISVADQEKISNTIDGYFSNPDIVTKYYKNVQGEAPKTTKTTSTITVTAPPVVSKKGIKPVWYLVGGIAVVTLLMVIFDRTKAA